MPAIDWASLGSFGGETIEDFAAACLRQRYDNAIQTRPAQGDGGVDVYRRTPDGLIVWQVKKFTAPLTSSQWKNVKKSWRRFWDTHVKSGEKIAAYYLLTPWTPTEGFQKKFDELTTSARFACQWDGSAFFDVLAADYPATYERYFKGVDALERFVNAKAMLASTSPEAASGMKMIDAIAVRQSTLQDLQDLVSDEYYVDMGTRTATQDGQIPKPGPQEAGILFRYTHLEGRRYRVESVVPKNVDSTTKDPILLDFRAPDGDIAGQKALRDWGEWGVPLVGIDLEIQHRGGPFGQTGFTRGALSIGTPAPKRDYPDLRIVHTGDSDVAVVLPVNEVTNGPVGNGLRVCANSASRMCGIELRFSPSNRSAQFHFRFAELAGNLPSIVRDDLSFWVDIRATDEVDVRVPSGELIARMTGLTPVESMLAVSDLAEALCVLQQFVASEIRFPQGSAITDAEVEDILQMSKVLGGTTIETTWQNLELPVKDMRLLSELRTEQPVEVKGRAIFYLGGTTYETSCRISYCYDTAQLDSGINPKTVSLGDKVVLVPGTSNRVRISLVSNNPNN